MEGQGFKQWVVWTDSDAQWNKTFEAIVPTMASALARPEVEASQEFSSRVMAAAKRGRTRRMKEVAGR
jgi:hypothetical protein